MKVTIDNKGTMKVTAETALEAYALAKWGEDYFGPSNQQTGKSVLMLDHSATCETATRMMPVIPQPSPGR